MNDVITYAVTVLVGIAAGIVFSAPVTRGFRPLTTFAGVTITIAVVLFATTVGSATTGLGPTYALVAAVTALLVSASVRSGEPALLAEPYWRRVVLILFHPGRLRSPRDADPIEEG